MNQAKPRGGCTVDAVRRAALVLVLVSLAVAPFLRRPTQQASPPERIDARPLLLSARPSLQAGGPLRVSLAPVDDGEPATLLVAGGLGMWSASAQGVGGQARFEIPPGRLNAAGALLLVGTVGQREVRRSVEVRPGDVAAPVVPLVGPRSIIANGADSTMVVAIPIDARGNTIAEGTPVDLRFERPDGVMGTLSNEVDHGVSWVRVPSGTRAGTTHLGVSVKDHHGPEGTLIEVPGTPVPFQFETEPERPRADGRSWVTLRTEIVKDQFGNTLLDGTLVTVTADAGKRGRRYVPAFLVDGRANVLLQAPLQDGPLIVAATSLGAPAEPAGVIFEAAGPGVDFPIHVTRDPVRRSFDIRAGPLTGALGQFIPDGTLATFDLPRGPGRPSRLVAPVDLGHASVSLPFSALRDESIRMTVEIGGGRRTVELPVPQR